MKALLLPLAIVLVGGLLLAAAPPARGQQPEGSQLASAADESTTAAGPAQQQAVPLSEIEDAPSSLRQQVTFRLQGATLETALRRFSAETGLEFVYGQEAVAVDTLLTMSVEAVPAHVALERMFRGIQRTVLLSESGQLILAPPGMADRFRAPRSPKAPGTRAAMQGTISGTVTSGGGEPLPGVNILVEGTQQGTATDVSGQYTITGVAPGTYTVRASFIGYGDETQEGVEVSEGETTTVDFEMLQEAQSLDEVVVVGYGEQQREDLTGSVSSVSTQDITAQPTANLAEALQGKAAGVQVTQSSGEPGSGMDVVIRGASTLGSSDPLYVIDGVPTGSDALTALNASDIASVEILKDASATAIYGSRAASGVVIIETKQGTPGDELQVQLSSRVGQTAVPTGRRLDMMDTEEFYEFSVDAYNNSSLPVPTAWQEPNLSENLQQNTDWQEALFEAGIVQDHNLRVSGGGETAVYSISGGYLNEEGVVVSDGFSRASFRVNSEYYLGSNDQLTLGERIGISRTRATGGISNDVFKETFQQSPTVPVRDPDNLGGFSGPTEATSPGFRLNQVALLHLEETEEVTQRLLGTVYGEYEFVPDLSYRLNLSTNLSNGEYQFFSPLYNVNSNANLERDLDQNRSENRAVIMEHTLNYDDTFAEVHQVQALAGFTREWRRYEIIEAQANGFPSGDLRTINAATGLTLVNGGATASRLQSFLGRVQYGYDDRYRAQFAIRRDGSSRFGRDSRWGTFPSGSVGWSVHNEPFMSDSDLFSQLRLRGSWGLTGSQTIPEFAAIPTVQPVANYVLGQGQQRVSGAAVLRLGNSDLQWQETQQTNVGLDVGFFDQRLSFTAEYFRKNTSNVLLQVPVATSSGIWRNQGAYQNVGEIQNSGLEFAASYQESFGDFSIQAAGNVSTINNEVQQIGVDQIVTTVSDELGEGQTITRSGSEVGAFYGWIAEGPFQNQDAVDSHATQPGAEPGDLRFSDLNGDGVIDSDDRTIIGSPFADFFYGLNLDLGYGGWGLRMQVDGVQGRDVFDLRADNDPKGFNNTTTDYLDRWTPDNREAAHPRATTTDPNGNLRSSTYRVKDGSYLALRNVTLSYELSPDLLSQWVGTSNVRVFVAGSNLLWLTPYDGYNPEVGAGAGNQASLTRSLDQGSYPIARTIEVGVDLSF